MNKPLIIVDVDDTILGWHEGFSEWLRETKKFASAPAQRPNDYDIAKWLGCTKERARELITEFNETSLEFQSLKPMPGARKNLVKLERHFRISICSAFSERPLTINKRLDNLERFFPDVEFEDFYALPLGAKKIDLFRHLKLSEGAIAVVEDAPHQALAAQEAGLQALLLALPHNSPERNIIPWGIPRFEQWGDIADYLISNYVRKRSA